jgi:hypothetical protein
MATELTTATLQTGTTAETELAKLRRDQKLSVDQTSHTRSHLEKLQKKELKKEARNPTTRRELTVAPKWRRREHPMNTGNAVRFGPDRVCQAANPRRDGPCRCTPCRAPVPAQPHPLTLNVFMSGRKGVPVCFDKRKRVGGTAAVPTVVVDRWMREDVCAPESETEDESGPHTAEEEALPRSHPTEVDILDLVKPAKSRKQKGEYHCGLSRTPTLKYCIDWLVRGQTRSATPSTFGDFCSVSEAWEELAEDQMTDWDACSQTTGFTLA